MHETEATITVSLRGEQRAGCGVPEPIDLVVDVRLLLDVGVGLGDVGLRLVVVVVRHEILRRVVRKVVLELGGGVGPQGSCCGR